MLSKHFYAHSFAHENFSHLFNLNIRIKIYNKYEATCYDRVCLCSLYSVVVVGQIIERIYIFLLLRVYNTDKEHHHIRFFLSVHFIILRIYRIAPTILNSCISIHSTNFCELLHAEMIRSFFFFLFLILHDMRPFFQSKQDCSENMSSLQTIADVIFLKIIK